MNSHFETRRLVGHQVGVHAGRRTLLKLTGVGVAVLSMMSVTAPAFAQSTLAWDKTFPKSERVDHRKVSFYNRLGITLVADLYIPKNIDRSRRHGALVVGGPYGAVKEQASGLYAQTMAERGFITIAHDPSYVGESGGLPHGIASPEALVEDFSSAVDFLGGLPFVARERIGVIGVGGSGGFGLAAAEIDPRIKAVATIAMYDIGQGTRQGLAETSDQAAFRGRLQQIAAQRWAEVDGAERAMVIGTPEALTSSSTAIDREFFDYYRTPRGQHPRATTAFSLTLAPRPCHCSGPSSTWTGSRRARCCSLRETKRIRASSASTPTRERRTRRSCSSSQVRDTSISMTA